MSLYSDEIVKHYDALLAYAVTLHNDISDAQDNVQEVVTKFLERDGDYKIVELKKIMMASIRNNFINTYRTSKKRSEIPFLDYLKNNSQKQDIPDFVLFADELMDAIDSMAPILSKALRMRVEGYKYKEIKEELKLPMGSVKVIIFTAKDELEHKANISQRNGTKKKGKVKKPRF